MGRLERDFKKRRQRADVQHLVLSSVEVAGVLTVALLAPNVLGALKDMGYTPGRRQAETIRAARNRLVENGLIAWEGKKLRLTEQGERTLRYWRLQQFGIAKPKRWDGRWRVLIFDIPEARKGLRERIRRTLHMIGFVRLQDSVWVFPYDCEDLITLLKADFKVGRDMLYMIVDSIEHDRPIRDAFGLK
jgi:DNA-binding transcriptional regulator PaaX